MDSLKNGSDHSQEEENFLRRKKKAKRDLMLIVVFLLLITGVMIFWFMFFSDACHKSVEPESTEVISSEEDTEFRIGQVFHSGENDPLRIGFVGQSSICLFERLKVPADLFLYTYNYQ